MSANYVIIGHFHRVDEIRAAMMHFQEKGLGGSLEYFSPFPDKYLEEQLYSAKRRSPVRICTLLGAVSGCLLAFLFTCWMSIDYPLRVSAKPLVSIPAFAIIAFECLIMFAALSAVLSMFHLSRIPNYFRPPEYRPVFSENVFGLCLRVTKDEIEHWKSDMQELGAEFVEVQYVR